jgi:hypothetical protein
LREAELRVWLRVSGLADSRREAALPVWAANEERVAVERAARPELALQAPVRV